MDECVNKVPAIPSEHQPGSWSIMIMLRSKSNMAINYSINSGSNVYIKKIEIKGYNEMF